MIKNFKTSNFKSFFFFITKIIFNLLSTFIYQKAKYKDFLQCG